MSPRDLLELARAGGSLAELRSRLAELLAILPGALDHARDGIVLREEGDGRSRFGGSAPPLPEAPELAFIAAVDLSELPAMAPLPAAGTLRFYWDASARGTNLVEATSVRFDEGSPEAIEGGTPLAGLAMPIIGFVPDAHMLLSDPELDELDAVLHELDRNVYGHQLLGASRDIQHPLLDGIGFWFEHGDPAMSERYTEAERAGAGWSLLAQFVSSGDVMFGDVGRLSYVVPSDDLHARRFDRAMAILEQH
jgi:hypothetical protein